MNTTDTIRDDYSNGGGGIRTHGALADTLVFKPSIFRVIPIDLICLDERKIPIVDQFKFITMCSFILNIFFITQNDEFL